MKKLLLIIILTISMTATTQAATLIDTTLFNANGTVEGGDLVGYGWGDVNKLDFISDYVTWKHQFVFNPPADQLLSATLTLTLRDDNDPIFAEFGFGWTEDGSWDIGEVDTGDYAYGINVAYLADGVFQVTLGSLLGDFYIDQSVLNIQYTSVPEPLSATLLGFGLVGIATLRRKFKS
ncbi:MAG TPA: PEP-CTERM sorting domain-containing protein [Syntrophorhabdaceae bacterium]|nr:PEP-CTERM sorting domain-containing protein [Syntrophorhabdaceae bacterium]